MKKLTGFNNVPTRFALSRKVCWKNGKKFVYYDSMYMGVTTVGNGFYYCPYVPESMIVNK